MTQNATLGVFSHLHGYVRTFRLSSLIQTKTTGVKLPHVHCSKQTTKTEPWLVCLQCKSIISKRLGLRTVTGSYIRLLGERKTIIG